MNKYRQYATPEGWCFDMSYSDVMQLRSAYNSGIKTAETREAARIYITWKSRMKVKRGTND